MDPRIALLFLKLSWFLGYILILFLFSPEFFKIFHNTVMIYNIRNRSNYTTESQEEKNTCFNVHAGKWNLNVQFMQTNLKGVYIWNKMWSLKSLVMFKCESRTSLHAVQHKWQSGFVDVLSLFMLEMASLDTLFLCSAGQQAWLCS